MQFLSISKDFDYPCSNSTLCHPIEISLHAGTWKFELWGASGGDSYYENYDYGRPYAYEGGKGGFSEGVFTLKTNTKAFLFIGGKGNKISGTAETITPGGYNGGGCGYIGEEANPTGSGGGSADIRLRNTDIRSRIIVAGGGGGAGVSNCQGADGSYGGSGGGLIGFHGGGKCQDQTRHSGIGGTQESGGSGGTSTGNPGGNGELFIGGNGGTGTISSSGGGGGGYYGGGGGASAGGGGGSGFVSSIPGSNSSQAKTIDGNQPFLSPNGSTEKGHTGNGFIRITLISLIDDYTLIKISFHEDNLLNCLTALLVLLK